MPVGGGWRWPWRWMPFARTVRTPATIPDLTPAERRALVEWLGEDTDISSLSLSNCRFHGIEIPTIRNGRVVRRYY